MNNVRVITPGGEIIGERILETELSIIVKTDNGRLSIDKNDQVFIYDYTDPASYDNGTIVRISTIFGQAAYMKTRSNRWVLVWQSNLDANENPALGNAFVINGAQLSFEDLQQLYVDTPETI